MLSFRWVIEMEYIHNRYNARVKVDDNGKKHIYKYGLVFGNFNELLKFEQEYKGRKNRASSNIDSFSRKCASGDIDFWLRAKGEY